MSSASTPRPPHPSSPSSSPPLCRDLHSAGVQLTLQLLYSERVKGMAAKVKRNHSLARALSFHRTFNPPLHSQFVLLFHLVFKVCALSPQLLALVEEMSMRRRTHRRAIGLAQLRHLTVQLLVLLTREEFSGLVLLRECS